MFLCESILTTLCDKLYFSATVRITPSSSLPLSGESTLSRLASNKYLTFSILFKDK